MRIECTTELTPDQTKVWQEFLAHAQRTHAEQDPRFANVIQADGMDVVFAMGWIGQKLHAVGMFELRPHPFLTGYYVHALAKSGPVCDNIEDLTRFCNALAKHEAFQRVGAVRVTPYWLEDSSVHLSQALKDNGWDALELENERQTGMIDLTGPVDDIVAGFSQTGRRKLRKAEQQDLTIESVQDAATALDILGRMDLHRGERGMLKIPEKTFLAAFEHVYRTDDLGTILHVQHQGRFVAALVLHRGRDVAHFMNSVHDEPILAELGNLRIAPFLLLQGMKWAKTRGCRDFDLEGYKWPADVSDPYYNIYKYKKELSPKYTLRVAGHQRIINQLAYLTGDAHAVLRRRLKPIKRRVKSALKQWKIDRENAKIKAD
jgi:hypothetical protein